MAACKLTALVTCCNESVNIAECLESVRWADEIIVVDSGSKDRTLEIAQSFGWRKESIQTMRVRQADFSSEEIRLDDSKNGEPVVAPMTRKIRELLAVCAAGKSQDDFLFTYPDGTPVKDFRKPWCRATMAAGVPDLLFHDLCRTGMRNMRRLGIDTDVAMKLAGRKTDSIFRRYNIVDSRDTREAVTKMDDYRHSSAIDGEALTVEVEMVQ